ncbi:MAG: beta-lactamase family protein [Clostridiaceae bacterium]|nr:beta-lactamase family protein [Clostridiaceae bacterium]
MKKGTIILTFIFGIFLICLFTINHNETINKLDDHETLVTKNQRDMIYNQIRQFPNETQIAISLIKDDLCIFYGVIKQNDTIEQIDNKKSLFEIGSITKVFTTTLLADFILDSTIALDRNINNDLDFGLNKNIHICYKDLANHTSGLPRRPINIVFPAIISPLNPYKFYDTNRLEKYLKKKLTITRESGLKYEYSNLGIGILGYLLCKIAKSDYETLLKEKIFSKYGLTNTTTIKENYKANLVQGLGPFGNKTPNWDLASLEGAGNILSSTSDLANFVKSQFDTSNVELSLTRETTFVVDSTLEIGLGWHILIDKSENNWYWHNGGTGGYRSSIVFDIDNKKGVIVLTNISVGHRKNDQIDDLCFELMKEL